MKTVSLLIGGLLAGLSLLFLTASFFNNRQGRSPVDPGYVIVRNPLLKPIITNLNPGGKPTPTPPPQPKIEGLKLDLSGYLTTRSGTWAISLEKGSDQIIQINTDRLLPAASVTKLVAALALIGAMEPDQSPETLFIEGQSAQTWLKSLINQSDNAAWDVLKNYLGFSKEQNLVTSLGLQQTDLFSNQISAGDVSQILHHLWLKRLTDPYPELFDYMLNTETEQRIPQGVIDYFDSKDETPPLVYHKSGSWPPTGTYNDAAIIPLDNTDGQVLFLSILSEGNDSQAEAEETIRSIIKIILNWFQN